MKDLLAWMQSTMRAEEVPLFETDERGVVQIKYQGEARKPILKRHPQMEEAMIRIVEGNLTDPRWEGLLYIMAWKMDGQTIPLYIGKAEKKGVVHGLSANIANIAKNKGKFARWGDGLDYHIGDLSHAVFGFMAYRKPQRKYKRWAETLFTGSDILVTDPTGIDWQLVRLKYPVVLILIPWFLEDLGPSTLPCCLSSAEKEVIGLAHELFPQYLLNKDGT